MEFVERQWKSVGNMLTMMSKVNGQEINKWSFDEWTISQKKLGQ